MAENENATTQPFDPLEISIHDMDASIDPEPGSTEPDLGLPVETSTEETKPEETKVETDKVEAEPADGDEEPDELAALGFPKLPEELAENAEISKRYEEVQYGISKVLRQQQEVLQTLRPYEKLAKDLENPETAQEAYDFLGKHLIEEGILKPGVQPQVQEINSDEWEENRTAWEGKGLTKDDYADAQAKGFEYPGEYKAYKLAKSENDAKYAPLEKERETMKAQKAFNDLVDAEHPRVAGFLAKTENGWSVTKEMVATALKTPGAIDDLPTAIKRAFPDEYANHKVQAALKVQTAEGPELLTKGGSGAKGAVLQPLDPDAPSSKLIHQIYENSQALASS